MGKRKYEPILTGANAETFGCQACDSVRGDMCWFDKRLPRPISTWGWCPSQQIEGPVQLWRGRRGAR